MTTPVRAMITSNKTGGRTIELMIPFDHAGKRIEKVVFEPLVFGHVMRWRDGLYKSFIEFMVEMSGLDLDTFKQIRFDDSEMVVRTFMGMLPPEIVKDVQEGSIPRKMDVAEIIDRFSTPMPSAEDAQDVGGFDIEPPAEAAE